LQYKSGKVAGWLKIWLKTGLSLYGFDSWIHCYTSNPCFWGHITKNVKAWLWREKCNLVIIPGGMTGILQPLNIVISQPFKAYFVINFLTVLLWNVFLWLWNVVPYFVKEIM
jgi:hypothetical protein